MAFWRCVSVPKIVAPKIRWNAATRRRYCVPPLHPEGVQHFSRAAEANYSVLLPNSERCKEERNEPVLTPWQSV
jgi:hypothetical protein